MLRASQFEQNPNYVLGQIPADMIPEQVLAEIIEDRNEGLVKPPAASFPSIFGVSNPEAIAFGLPASSGVLMQEPSNSSNLYTVQLTRQPVPVTTNGATVYHKSAYFGELKIGEPPVKFTVVFDTGSGHLVLPSTYCRSETCKVHTRYSRRASLYGRDVDFDGSTVLPGHPRDQITISFGTGEVSGVFVEDHVCLRLKSNEGEQQPSAKTLEPFPGLGEGQELPEGCLKMR